MLVSGTRGGGHQLPLLHRTPGLRGQAPRSSECPLGHVWAVECWPGTLPCSTLPVRQGSSKGASCSLPLGSTRIRPASPKAHSCPVPPSFVPEAGGNKGRGLNSHSSRPTPGQYRDRSRFIQTRFQKEDQISMLSASRSPGSRGPLFHRMVSTATSPGSPRGWLGGQGLPEFPGRGFQSSRKRLRISS